MHVYHCDISADDHLGHSRVDDGVLLVARMSAEDGTPSSADIVMSPPVARLVADTLRALLAEQVDGAHDQARRIGRVEVSTRENRSGLFVTVLTEHDHRAHAVALTPADATRLAERLDADAAQDPNASLCSALTPGTDTAAMIHRATALRLTREAVGTLGAVDLASLAAWVLCGD